MSISNRATKNLLLIYPGQLFSPCWGGIVYTNPSLVNLSAYLRQYECIKTQVLDLDIEIGRPSSQEGINAFKKRAREIIKKYKFDIVGISCSYSINYLSAIIIADICRDISRDCIIAVGGIHASAVPDDFCFTASPFDFIVIGEGERPLLNICLEKIKKTGGPKKIIAGLTDLDTIPSPHFDDYKYLNSRKGCSVIYALSRGCPFNCSFCIESAKSGPNYRCLPVKRALREIQQIADLGVKKIKLHDPCFGLKKEWRRGLFNGLLKIKNKCVFEFETRVDLMSIEDIKLLSKLNIEYLYLGLEHASVRMLSLMQKTKSPGLYLKKAKKVIRLLNEADVPNKILLIFNHPGETKSSIRQAIGFLRSSLSGLRTISSILAPKNYFFAPGTKTFYNIEKYEKEFGTNVKYKTWWKIPYFDQLDFASDILPSQDFYGENARIFWEKDIGDIRHLCDSRRSKNFLAFQLANKILLKNIKDKQ